MCTWWLSKWTYQLSKVELAKWWGGCGCRLLAEWTWQNKECQLSKIAEQMVIQYICSFSLGSGKLDKLGLHLWLSCTSTCISWKEIQCYGSSLTCLWWLWGNWVLEDCMYLMPSDVVSKWSFCDLNCISNYSSCYKNSWTIHRQNMQIFQHDYCYASCGL
jgi:hypothetical protein